jgi:hypothetical protein
MTSDTREVLSALIDREPVDPDLLARVLEEPDARALLIDFVRLRASLIEEGEEAREAMRPPGPTVARRFSRWRWMRVAAAAALSAAMLSGGVWVGTRLAEERPPTPSRVIEFQPGVDWQTGS